MTHKVIVYHSPSFINSILLKRIEKWNGIDANGGVDTINCEVNSEKAEIDLYIKNHVISAEEKILYEKFTQYSKSLEKLILAKRIESGTYTLFFFLYSIASSILGVIMEIIALLTTVGLTGHIILAFSIMGGVFGAIMGLISLRREREFMLSLRNGF